MEHGDDGGSDLAQTGSLFHVAVAAFHKSNNDDTAIRTMQMARTEFPLGNMDEATKLFRKYLQRQEDYGVIHSIEQPISFDLEPSPIDTTKKAIRVTGTLDLSRRVDSTKIFFVDDHKTGRTGGDKMIWKHATQLAAYMHGFRRSLNGAYPDYKIVGRILRTQSLSRVNLQYIWEMPFTEHEVPLILNSFRHDIALLRAGQIAYRPGEHCAYCPIAMAGRAYPYCVIGRDVPKSDKRVALPDFSNPFEGI